MTARSLLRVAVIFLGFAFGQIDWRLEENSPFMFPLEDRFEPDPISMRDSLACLFYNINRTLVATADFDRNVVFVQENISGGSVYSPRAVPFRGYFGSLQWELWQSKMSESVQERARMGTRIEIPMELPPAVRGVIGAGGAGLSVNGRYKITMAGRSEWSDQEVYYGSKWPQLQMEQESNFTITGTIGTKVTVKIDQDSKRATDLENTINIKYTGEEDDVVQSIEAGNTTLSLPGGTLAGYTERVQGLFGIKSVFQVGDWNITAIASQEKSNTQRKKFTPGIDRSTIHIVDWQYKARTYYYLGDAYAQRVFNTSDTIVELKLYKRVSNPINAIFGYAIARDVSNVSELPHSLAESDSVKSGYYVEISPSLYDRDRVGGWIRLVTPAGRDDVLGVRYIVKRAGGTHDTVGFCANDSCDTMYLKLIKPDDLRPDHPCWEYEWRNVYDLQSEDLDISRTEIRLFYNVTSAGRVDSSEVLPNTTDYFLLKLFNMDSIDLSGAPISDGIVDQTTAFIDPGRGELIFPVPHPFDPQPIDIALRPLLSDFPESLRNPGIYTSTNQALWERYSRCFLSVKREAFSTVQNLGDYNIIENSEIVTANGVRLKKGEDYIIDYTIGQIKFISDPAKDPNARIEIEYESRPFFSADQKTLLGSRAQYELWENSWFGVTGLYKNLASPDRRPRVGQEPSKAFIALSDLKLRFDMPFVTSVVDAIPLVQTDSPSSSEITLEIAKVFSNPNTRGVAYIDDFESSKESDRISINRPRWTLSSAPEGYEDQPRARIIWYNPYDRVNVRDIWPNRQVQSAQSKVDVLTLEFIDTTSTPGDSMPWAGVMQYIQPGFQDQQYTQFLEIWVLGNEGILNIDLGTISEDVNGDGILQTEDKYPYDNVLTQDEDVGLDGLPNHLEPGYGTDNRDPNGDDYYYTPGTNDYSGINGTEGNRNDAAGFRNTPDTEDLNSNGALDRTNRHFTYEIDLSSEHFEVPGTRSPAGWRLYRIPLRQEYFRFVEDGKVWRRKSSIDPPDTTFTSVKYIRLWITGVSDNNAKVSIAEINLVRNQWLETFDHFEIAVKNSQEDLDYTIPPDVTVEVDPTTNIPREEKSLALKYDNLPPLDTVWAFKNLPGTREEDYTFYSKMSLWVNYDSTRCEGSAPIFFLRMGDKTRMNYYEFRSIPLDQIPADPRDNTRTWRKIAINFAELTNFKDEYLKALSDTTIDDIPPIRPTRDGTGYFHIHGAPSLTRISHFEMGIINPDQNFSISGEIWCDELVLEDVRKEPGVARKGEFKFQMADFAGFVASATEQDENFHTLNQARGSGNWSRNQNYTLNLSLHKFFPSAWGVNLPLSLTYADIKTVPRFRTGTDIVLDPTRRENEKTVSYSRGIALAGIGIAPQNPSWAMGLFVIPNRLSYSTNRTITHSPAYPDELSRTTIIRHTYNWAPKELIGVKFGKGDTTQSSAERRELTISIIPSRVDIVNEINDGFNYRRTTGGAISENHTKTLQHTTSLRYKPIDVVTADFGISMARSIKDPSTIRFGFPTIIGIGLRKSINDGITFSPRWADFLTQQYSFTSQYSENTDPVSRRNLAGFGSVNQTRNIGVNMTLMLKKLFGTQNASAGSKTSKIISMLDDVRGDYRWTATQGRNSLERRPGRLFQLGLTGNPGVPNAVQTGQQTTTQTDFRKYTDDLSLSSGILLPYDIKADTRYRYTLDRNYGTTYTKKGVTTFPDISATWGFVKNIKFFKSFTRSVSANSGWKYKTSAEYAENVLSKKTFESNFSPLLSMNFSLKNGVNIEIRHNYQSTRSEQYTQARTDYNLNKQNETSIVVRYTVRAQKGIKIPVLGSITFENNLNLSLNMTRTGNKMESWRSSENQRNRLRDNTVWSVKPQATYELSRNAVAGIQIDIREDTNNMLDITRHLREVRIWVQFEFGGGTTIGGTPTKGTR